MAEFIYLNSRDELLRINISSIVCLEASGNYTRILLRTGHSAVVGLSLAKMEKMLVASAGESTNRYVRIGKSHIINLGYIMTINVLRQELILSDQKSFTQTLQIPKEPLRKLKELLFEAKQTK